MKDVHRLAAESRATQHVQHDRSPALSGTRADNPDHAAAPTAFLIDWCQQFRK